MYLREICVGADEELVERYKGGFVSQFNQEASCVTELYRFLIRRRVQTNRLPIVVFCFTDRKDAHPSELHPVNACFWRFDFHKYQQSDKEAKKRLILDTLQEAVLWLAGKLQWDSAPFEEAYAEALRRHLTLESFLKKSWPSPSHPYRVRVYFRFDLDAVYLEAVLCPKGSNRELVRKPMGTARPYPGCITDYAGEGQWVSETTFQLRSSSFLREVWTVDFWAEMER